jgi:hypothetical protein
MRTSEPLRSDPSSIAGARNRAGRRFGVLCGAVALVLLSAGCGEEPGHEAAAISATSAQLIALKQQISGTSAARSAADFLAEHAVDTAVHDCMAEDDLPYPIRSVDEAIGTQPTSLGESWAFPLHDKTVLTNLQVWAEKYPQFEQIENGPSEDSVKYTDAYSQALSKCEADIKWPGADYAEPKDREGLAYVLFVLVTSTEAEFGQVGVYDKCMQEAGYDTVVEAEDFSGMGGLYQLIWGNHPDWDVIPEVGAEGGAEWAEFKTWVNKVLDADADCRQSRHKEVLAALGPLLTDFEERNAQALAELSSGWAEVISEARAQGWVDRTPKYSAATG